MLNYRLKSKMLPNCYEEGGGGGGGGELEQLNWLCETLKLLDCGSIFVETRGKRLTLFFSPL